MYVCITGMATDTARRKIDKAAGLIIRVTGGKVMRAKTAKPFHYWDAFIKSGNNRIMAPLKQTQNSTF